MDYKIRYMDMPYKVKGITVKDDTGFYNVYINARLSKEVQDQATRHELTHITRNDFGSLEPIQNIEKM